LGVASGALVRSHAPDRQTGGQPDDDESDGAIRDPDPRRKLEKARVENGPHENEDRGEGRHEGDGANATVLSRKRYAEDVEDSESRADRRVDVERQNHESERDDGSGDEDTDASTRMR